MSNLREQAEAGGYKPAAKPAPKPAQKAATAPSQLERDLQTIRSNGAVAIGGGQVIRRGADKKIYLVGEGNKGQRYDVTSPVGLEQAKKANAITELSIQQAGQVIQSSRQPTPTVSTKQEGRTPTTGNKQKPKNGSGSAGNKSNAASPAKEPEPKVERGNEGNIPPGAFGDNSGNQSVNQYGGFQSFNIANFRENIQANGILPNHSYLVTFAPFRSGYPENEVLNNTVMGQNMGDILTLRCESISIPQIQTTDLDDIRRYGYGTIEKVPYNVQFGDLSMTFILDNMAQQIEFFYQWMNLIVSYESQGGYMQNKSKTLRRNIPGDPYEVGYKDMYSNPVVRVNVYNKKNELVMFHEFYDVYPQSIEGNTLDWSNVDQHQKLSVRLGFTDMYTEVPNATNSFMGHNIQLTKIAGQREFEQRMEQMSDMAKEELDKSIRSSIASIPDLSSQLPDLSGSYNASLPTVKNTVATTVGSKVPPQSIIKTMNG